MNALTKIIFAAAVLIGIILTASDLQSAEACEETPVSFDLSVIEQWCGGNDRNGSLRFVGAEVYERDGDKITLLDEQGQLWVVSDIHIEDEDFLLLWIQDNDTDDFSDDVVVKVWREAH